MPLRFCFLVTVLVCFTLFDAQGTHSAASADTMPFRPAMETAPMGDFFRDDFDGPALIPEWSWINEDASSWSLTERPGYLRIHTQPGTLDEANNSAHNVLLRAAPPAPYVLSTRFELHPTQEFHEAGLLVYQDADNYVKLSRLYSTRLPSEGDDFYLLNQEVAGVRSGAIYVPTSQQAIELQLLVEATNVTGAYRDASGRWITLGTLNVGALASSASVGILANNGISSPPALSIPVDFDFVTVGAPPLHMYLPLVSRQAEPGR